MNKKKLQKKIVIIILLSTLPNLINATSFSVFKDKKYHENISNRDLTNIDMKTPKKDLVNSKIILAYDFSSSNRKRSSFLTQNSHHDIKKKKINPYEIINIIASIVFKNKKAKSLESYAFADTDSLSNLDGITSISEFSDYKNFSTFEALKNYRDYSSRSKSSDLFDYTTIIKKAYSQQARGVNHIFLMIASPLISKETLAESFEQIKTLEVKKNMKISLLFIDISNDKTKQNNKKNRLKIKKYIDENINQLNKKKRIDIDYCKLEVLLNNAEEKNNLNESVSFLITNFIQNIKLISKKEENKSQLLLHASEKSRDLRQNVNFSPLEGEAASMLEILSTSGYKLQDTTYIMDRPIESIQDIKEALSYHLGHGLSSIPSEQEIVNDLNKLNRTLNEFQEKAYITDSISSLKHSQTCLRKKIVGKPYISRLKEIHGNSDYSNQEFYLKIYNQLSKDNIVNKVKYPDPEDKKFDTNINEKIKDLINLLADIKDPHGRKMLNENVYSNKKPLYPTRGQTAEWFAEQRYKLYFIAKSIPKISDSGKKNLLSYLIHAGKHCCDAKQAAIDDLFKHFCSHEYSLIKSEELEYASNLKDRILYLATLEKMSILDRLIKSEIDNILRTKRKSNLPSRFTVNYLEKERMTFETATWDHYAEVYGVPKKTTQWPNMHITLPNSFTANGNYSPLRLFRLVSSHHKEQILEETVGCLKFLYPDHDSLILGWLQKEDFLEANFR